MSLESATPSTSTPKVVRFQINYNLRSLFLSYANESDRNSYEEFLRNLKSLGKEIRDDDLLQFLKEARGCISILTGKFKLFVELILIYQWVHRSKEVVSEYEGFLLDLCSAHCDYTKPVFEHLINYFKTDAGDWKDDLPGEKTKEYSQILHEVIKSILAVVPMSRVVLLNSLKQLYPYLRRPYTEQRNYVYNILQIVEYEPTIQLDILTIVIDKLVILDSHCPRDELDQEQYDVDDIDDEDMYEEAPVNPKKQITDSLDASLYIVYRFLWERTHDEMKKLAPIKMQTMYRDVMEVFDKVILQTHNINHVQFIVFYLLSLRPALAPVFIESLWKKVSDVNVPPVIRQAAVNYMASFITRATYVSIKVMQETLTAMASWIHCYIDCEESPSQNPTPDTRVHGVFYTTCQALFYIIAFRHKDLIYAGLSHLESLRLPKIVTCRLNPLKVCFPVVVNNFSGVARSYQLAYCNTVLERNARSILPTVHQNGDSLSGSAELHLDPFFPFDPYHLRRSRIYIVGLYRVYCGMEFSGGRRRCAAREEDDDDFLDLATPRRRPSTRDRFSFSTSPGFLDA